MMIKLEKYKNPGNSFQKIRLLIDISQLLRIENTDYQRKVNITLKNGEYFEMQDYDFSELEKLNLKETK